jgi:hypothetical protein
LEVVAIEKILAPNLLIYIYVPSLCLETTVILHNLGLSKMDAPLPNSFFSTIISDQLPNGQVFTGMGWIDEEGYISHLTTISNIHSPEECMDECASNRKSNGQGCVAFTFVEDIKR